MKQFDLTQQKVKTLKIYLFFWHKDEWTQERNAF